MYALLFLIALAWVAAGAKLILDTAQTRTVLDGFFTPERLKGFSILPLGLGVFLVAGSFTMERLFWWGFLIGAAAVAKGVYLLRASPAQAAALLEEWVLRPEERTLRLWGIVALVLGTILLTRLAG